MPSKYCYRCRFSGKIAAGAVVCVESEIRGDVTIGKRLFLLSLEKFSVEI